MHISGTCQKMPATLVSKFPENSSPHHDMETLFSLASNNQPLQESSATKPEQLDEQIHGYGVNYVLKLGETTVSLNDLLEKEITLNWHGDIHCVSCGTKTKKSYAQGHCYMCFKNSASCDLCMMQPERCHFHLGTCREPDWAENVCFREHVVYLSYTSGVKVGITRRPQVPTRWIDQGAVAALPIFTTSSRRMSGIVEQYFKDFLADKTDWRKMLKSDCTQEQNPAQVLLATRNELYDNHLFALQEVTADKLMLEADSHQVLHNLNPITIDFPVLEYPQKIKSLNLEKTPEISGTLLGIKGQYLIFDTGVLNVRKFSGFELEVEI